MTIKENINQVNKRISEAAEKTGRTQENIQLVAITKTIDTEHIKEAIACGIDTIGENRIQEAFEKWKLFQDIQLHVEWHLVGHLQSNKVKKAVEMFELIHSIDSLGLLLEIEKHAQRMGKVQDVLLQVNVAEENTKYGIHSKDLFDLCDRIINHSTPFTHVRIRGLMTIGPFTENKTLIRQCFKKTHQLFLELKEKNTKPFFVDTLSMGMSGDFEIAIEEGSTLVRIGSSIFGERGGKNYEK